MQDDPRKVSSTGEIVIYGRIFHPLPILILFSSHTAEKLHLLVIKEISLFERQSVFSNFLPLPYRSATLAQTPSQTANNWCTFLYRCPEVFKAPRNGSVCQKCFKNTSDSPSASISSRQRIATAPRALLAVNFPPPPDDTGPALFSILSLIYASIQQDKRGRQRISQPHPVPFVHRSHGLGLSRSSLISIIHEGPLALLSRRCQPL